MPQIDWNATISSLEERLPKAQFQNWVKPLTLVHCDDERIVVGVPNQFHGEWVRNNYSGDLTEAIQRQCGTPLQLEFELLIENKEASQSNQPEATAEPQRPNLRIVDPENPPAPSIPKHDSKLPKITDPFLSAGYNQFALECARLFTQGTATLNPMIVHGDVGMGKTHLLVEIARLISKTDPSLKVRYMTVQAFHSEWMQSWNSKDMGLEFKSKYRMDTDVLIFDDFHDFSGKLKTQDEFLHIFNELVSRGKRIVFATSVSPQKLEKFNAPLKSRLMSCVVAELKTPTLEDRVELLGKKAAGEGIQLETPVLRSLAAQGQKDVRELIGSLIRVHLQAKIENRPLTQELIGPNVSSVSETRREAVTMEEIISLVESNFDISRVDLVSRTRKSKVAHARQVAMYLARHYTSLALKDIGEIFGRDHATVIHAYEKVKESMEKLPQRRYEVDFLKKKLSARAAIRG